MSPTLPSSPEGEIDLFDSDLNPLNPYTPPRRSKPLLSNQTRSPSTSPPPQSPSVEYMREGYSLDDAWMMVEDEFLATAQLYTQHLHHAAYAEQKRRAQARGERVLRTMERHTDGRTRRDGMVVEREERERGIRKAVDEEEDEEGELTDPLLGALMNDPRRMGRALEGVGKVKSESRAAKGFLRSPEKAKRTFGLGERGGGEEVEGEDEEDAESDDLDGPVRKSKIQSTSSSSKGMKPSTVKANSHQKTHLFKKFAAAEGEERYRPAVKTNGVNRERLHQLDDRKHRHTADTNGSSSRPSKSAFTSYDDDFEGFPKPPARETTLDYLAKRRQRKEEEEKARKAKEKKVVEIPTFLF